jgi:outer membrane protein assembly factor BamB
MPPVVISGNFGSGTSPVLADGLVVLVRDETKDPRILAFDAATGKPRWEKKRQPGVSYCTPVVWATTDGKQIVAAGHGRMIGYDLKTGDEKWFLPGMPSGPCASPVVADGNLFFAGWSPGGPDDKSFQLPTFDAVLKQADAEKEVVLSREKAQKTFAKDLFDAVDANGDGVVTRDEWEAVVKFLAEGKPSPARPLARRSVCAPGHGDCGSGRSGKQLSPRPGPVFGDDRVLLFVSADQGGWYAAHAARWIGEHGTRSASSTGRH